MMMQCPRCSARFMDHAERCPYDDAPLAAAPDPLIGRILSERYCLEECIGSGGMGAVYRARHVSLAREVAVKVLAERFASDVVLVKRFVREARVTNLLRHDHIVDIYDVGHEGEVVFYVMDLLKGETLTRRIARGPVPPLAAIELVIPVASALAHAHALGVIHRDIKPENLFLCEDDGHTRARILDFGIAHVRQELRLTETGQVLGTPYYMSPEQVMGLRVSPASDLYALGVTLFEMLSGALPFDGTAAVVTVKHVRESPPDLTAVAPHVPPGLAALVMKLLAKDPAARPPGAQAVMDELRALRRSLQPPSPAAPPTADARRGRESLLRIAVAAAYPEESAPAWVARALDELAENLDGVRGLEQEVHALTREITRVEEHARAAREQLARVLEAVEAELTALEREGPALQRRMEPLVERMAVATEALSSTWKALRASMDGPRGLSEEALDGMERLGREAMSCREARRARDACVAEVEDVTTKHAEAQDRHAHLRARLAAAEDETRSALTSLRRRAVALGADIAAHHEIFAAQAEALERHLAVFPMSNSLLPSG